jgi:uncharacterized membrane protein
VAGRIGALLVGVGLGGLLDGVVLHQVLRWHHFVSAKTTDETVAGLEENTLADGLFHFATIIVLAAAIALVAQRGLGTRALLGFALVGWGFFNITDQLLFHLALELHHIRDDTANVEFYDWGFFGFGVAIVALGMVVARGDYDRGDGARARVHD